MGDNEDKGVGGGVITDPSGLGGMMSLWTTMAKQQQENAIKRFQLPSKIMALKLGVFTDPEIKTLQENVNTSKMNYLNNTFALKNKMTLKKMEIQNLIAQEKMGSSLFGFGKLGKLGFGNMFNEFVVFTAMLVELSITSFPE